VGRRLISETGKLITAFQLWDLVVFGERKRLDLEEVLYSPRKTLSGSMNDFQRKEEKNIRRYG
jgi:hypothetical protein